MEKACLVLGDGSVFEGNRFGARKDRICEIVFSTGCTGYLELLTDASYVGQGVVLTTPIVGNYGVFEETSESVHPWVYGLIIRDLSTIEGDPRNAESLDSYLKRNGIPGLYGVDTRAITLIIREQGTMPGMIVGGTKDSLNISEVLEKINKSKEQNLVEKVSRRVKEVFPVRRTNCPSDSFWSRESLEEGRSQNKESFLVPDIRKEKEKMDYKIALMDFGVKQNIVWSLIKKGCEVTVYPWDTPGEEILRSEPDGIVLSNGPGNPKDCLTAAEEVRKLYESGIPVMGICLGHQLMALATGADTVKLRYGHRGCNHPVKDLTTGKVTITSQNHSYVIKEDSLSLDICEISHVNMNDGSVEGLRYKKKPVFTVQYHPEGSPGPWDNQYLFDEFFSLIEKRK